MDHEIVIIGGGLSGLHSASELIRQGKNCLLIEARDRLGGRILSKHAASDLAKRAAFDLGPTWFWPGQRRMDELLRRLGLDSERVDQFAAGDQLVEQGPGAVARGDFGVTMAGSFRLDSGMASLIDKLALGLPREAIQLSTSARGLKLRPGGVEIESEGPRGRRKITAQRVVIAVPPRVALAKLDFEPALPPERLEELRSIATWMASQGKFLALYDSPFWRTRGLSGDAVSYVGPLGEIHDVTPIGLPTGALFGFFGLPASSRRIPPERLERACIAQLQRLFGEAAAHPNEVFLKDWAFDGLTATTQDLQGPAMHSLTGLRTPVEPHWHDRVLWSGSETAGQGERNNGYLEGALEASERTLEFLRVPLPGAT